MADTDVLKKLHQDLLDKGLLIEAGWVSLRLAALPGYVNKVQLEEMRNAFFAGAQHLFGSIMTLLDPEQEPTDADLQRMDMIHQELQAFLAEFKRKHGLP